MWKVREGFRESGDGGLGIVMSVRFPMSLADATVQDIQLELIRRTRFNAFDGERVVASLLARPQLWEAVLMDRFCFSNPGKLPSMGLIKLRDLADNIWNVDTLYILTPDQDSATELSRLAEAEEWGGMVRVHLNSEDVDSALGGADEGKAVVSIWWD
jgi:hypothetical protein